MSKTPSHRIARSPPRLCFCWKPEVSADTSSCCFRSNNTTGNVNDHQTFLSLICPNLPYRGLGWLKLKTLFSKDILVHMFSRIPCRMAPVNGDENAAPSNLESSYSDSNTETSKKGSLTLGVILFEWRARRQKRQQKSLVLSKNGGTRYQIVRRFARGEIMLFKMKNLNEILIFILLVKGNCDVGWQNADCIGENVTCLLASWHLPLLR